jgi:hypothetical protein
MSVESKFLWVLGALLFAATPFPASAQQVYKCWSKGRVVYGEKPCSKRTVNTDEATLPVKPNPKEVDVQRIEHNRVAARSLRRRDGESEEQFEVRRHRARMMETDRDECARIDARMPVEQQRMKSPDKDEIAQGEAGLLASRKRFAQLGC